MNAPEINIKFIEAGNSAPTRVEKGIVLLLINEIIKVPLTNPLTILDKNDIPDALSDINKDFIKLALKGYDGEAPKKIIVYSTNIAPVVTESELNDMTTEAILELAKKYNYDLTSHTKDTAKNTVITDFLAKQTAAEVDIENVLKAVSKIKFTYMAYPEGSAENYGKIKEWVIEQRENTRKVKAVLPNTAGDNEGIINYTNNINTVAEMVKNGTEDVIVETTYTAAQFTARIAGLLAAVPNSYSATYATLGEVVSCDEVEDRDKAVSEGKFFIFHDGEKIKTCRAVNSLQTTTKEKGEDFKKIRLVHIMDTINNDIETLVEDEYLGKYPNTYDNKCILISAIDEYLRQLENKGMINSHTIDIDVAAQKEYLKEKGVDVSEMTDDEIKQALTGTNVFLAGTVELLDAIEDLNWNISI